MTISEATTQNKFTDPQTLRQEVLDMVSESERRLTPGELEKKLSQKLSVGKKTLKTAIRNLVTDGDLIFTYTFGCSFLETSFNKPTRISKRIVLKPPGRLYRPKSDDIVIELQPGASFGTGGHPTTRLAARGIEEVLSKKKCLPKETDIRALDIGTGSGILAIIGVLLGVKRAVGIDIDPCAIVEAKTNIKLNSLERQIEIHDKRLDTIDDKFSIITANLRFPTVKRICPQMVERTEKEGSIIVSGIKTDEVSDLLYIFSRQNFRCVWKEFEKDWAGLVFALP